MDDNIMFAQKASAIVKAAGFDPRAINVETFKKLAPLIFTRAYCAIYKENLISILNEFSSKEEQILNSQLVVDGLTAKTRKSQLASISGIDIYQGNSKAINILVNILFSEGQRLWIEKLKQKQSVNEPTDYTTGQNLILDETLIKDNSQGEGSHNISPRELDKLLNRINYLEDKLKKKSKKPKKRPQSANKALIHPNKEDRNSLSPNRSANGNESDISEDSGKGNFEFEAENAQKQWNHLIKKKARPSSAPSHNRTKEISSRLYPKAIPIQKEEIIQTPLPKPPQSTNSNSIFTYDLKSGRRILISQAEAEREERKRAKEAMGNIISISKMDDDFMMGNPYGDDESKKKYPPLPAKSEYPCKRIEKSVETWLEKIHKSRVQEQEVNDVLQGNISHLPSQDAQTNQLPPARNLEYYQRMKKFDLLLTIEHCHNCQHHNVSLRHDPNEYLKYADDYLRMIGQMIFQFGACVRLGIVRLPADITPKSKTSDVGNRIGALEIQLAYRTVSGEVLTEVLHSKLTSRRWPSKSVIEKRLQNFLTKAKIAHFYENNNSDLSENIEYDPENHYPVGRFTWLDTSLSNPSWSYSVDNKGSSSINYVFDTSVLSDQPKFPVGSTIWIKNVSFAPGSIEKYPLLGVVKRYEGPKENMKGRILSVRLKYHQDEIVVSENDCLGLNEFKEPVFTPHSTDLGKLPFEMEAFLLLAYKEKALEWKKIDSDDQQLNGNNLILSRSSFFHQIRRGVWTLINKFKSRGINTLTHPISGRIFDGFLIYTENMIEKILNILNTDKIIINSLNSFLPSNSSPPEENFEVEKKKLNDYQSHLHKEIVPKDSETKNSLHSNQTIQPIRHHSQSSEKESVDSNPPHAKTNSFSSPVGESTTPLSSASSNIQRSSITPRQNRPVRPQLDIRPTELEMDKVLKIFHSESSSSSLPALPIKVIEKSMDYDAKKVITLENFVMALHESNFEMIANDGSVMKSLSMFFAVVNDTNKVLLNSNAFNEWLSTSPSSRKVDTPRTTDNSSTVLKESPLVDTSKTLSSKQSQESNIPVISDSISKSIPENPIIPDQTIDIPLAITEKDHEEITVLPESNTPVVQAAIHTDPQKPTSPRIPQEIVSIQKEIPKQKDPDQNLNIITTIQNLETIISPRFVNTTENIQPSTKDPSPILNSDSKVSPREIEINNSNENNSKENNSNNVSPRPIINIAEEKTPAINYQSKDVTLEDIILEGNVLCHDCYDTVYVVVKIESRVLEATLCLTRERGSKRRSFKVNWRDILINSTNFNDKFAIVALVISDESLKTKFPVLEPMYRKINNAYNLNNFTGTHIASIPLSDMYNQAFELKHSVQLPNPVDGVLNTVSIIIHGFAHEAKEARTSRIMSMKPTELLNLKFEPLPIDDDSDESDIEISPLKTLGKSQSNFLNNSDSLGELNQTLFPKASLQNLFSPVTK